MGHFASECLSKEKNEQANLTETEEPEPTLLLIEEICELNVSKEEIYIEEPSLLMIETCEANEGEVYVAATGGGVMKEAGWYLDTGASNHMTGDINCFSEIDQSIFGKVKFGDESVINIHGLGSVLFQCKNGEHLTLTNVYYIPKLKSNIISLGQIDENGGHVFIGGGFLKVYDDLNRLTIKVMRQPNRLFVAKLQVAEKVCLMTHMTNQNWLWHARCGHLNFQALAKMSKQRMVEGLPEITQTNQVCDGCVVGKQHRLPFPHTATFRAKERLALIHGDLCGPISPTTPGGNKYFMLLVDDCSRFMWIFLLKGKGEAFEVFKRFKKLAESESGERLKCFRTDRGGEFNSTEFKKYCEEKGVKRHFTAPFSPQQNGVVERRNQTVLEMARCIMKSKSVPAEFWGEAVKTSVYVLNRSSTKSVERDHAISSLV